MFDLHRHDEYSTFDGFGKAKELAEPEQLSDSCWPPRRARTPVPRLQMLLTTS